MIRNITCTGLAAVALSVGLLQGCSGDASSPGDAPAGVASTEDEVVIPTAEEAEAAAAAEITETNADEAYDELVREIEADGGADG